MPPPLLQHGDRLSREEFLRRWESMPDLKFAELINGVEDLGSPVSAEHDFMGAAARPEFGGQSCLEGSLLAGAPELAVEVAVSSSSRDLGLKSSLYERAGVIEYLVVLPRKRRAEWKRLSEGRYQSLEPDADGIYRSRVFPGLWLDPDALWRRDGAQLLRVLNQGLATPEHAEFVRSLEARRYDGQRSCASSPSSPSPRRSRRKSPLSKT